MLKNFVKYVLFAGTFVSCLQMQITFVELNDFNHAHRVVVEFRQVLDGSLPAVPESIQAQDRYRLMYKPQEVYASLAEDHFWVAKGSEIRADREHIVQALVRESANGTWAIFFVFNKEFSSKLFNIAEKNRDQALAFILNGQLLTVPQPLSVYLNSTQQFQFVVPTHFKSKFAAERFLLRFNL